MKPESPIDIRAEPWRDLLVTCARCSRKLDGGGYGAKGREPLGRVLKAALRATGRRGQVRLVQSRCLGLCPKRAVTVACSATPGRLHAVPEGARAEVVLARVFGGPEFG